MGCAASKVDNEDTVKRCRERRRLMHEAVRARHHMAAAHADYCRSLRLAGASLCAFAAGEQLSVAEETPPVLVRSPTPERAPPESSPSPPRTVASTKSSRVASVKGQKRNFRVRPKLPHILSDSELSSPGRTLKSDYRYSGPYRGESTYSNTPSQASSAWNWENFYPPSPPDSEYFERKVRDEKIHHRNQQVHHLNVEDDNDSDSGEESDAARADSEYDFFRPPRNDKNSKKRPEEMEREEVQCSEWEDHDHDCYSTSSSSPESEPLPRSQEASRKSPEVRSRAESFRREASPPRSHAPSSLKEKSYVGGQMHADMRMVVRHKDLREIVAAIKKNFDDAASSGEQLSDILEIGRAQLDRSFRNLKKTVYHSSGILSNLSSNWTSKPPLAVKYRLEADTGNLRSLLSTVERLLAWEKKLYEDVKAREAIKIAHEKKLSTLQSQEYKGDEDAKLDKTKSSIKKLNARIMVHSQAVTATSSAITSLRDSDLVPQLVELCHGMMYMWKAMLQYHEVQNVVVQQVRGLVNQSSGGESTSELHRLATRDLESAIASWHSSFCRLMKFQRDFIQSIQSWFKLTLHPVASDGKMEQHEAFAFFDEWKLALDRVPDTVASEAIKSFVNVVHVIAVKQTEELKIKRKTEALSKELEKKSSSLRNIERKFYQSYSTVGLGLNGPENGVAVDGGDPLAEKKSELAACQRRVEDELLRHAKAADVTRAMTLNNLQTGLPGVFQAMTNFSTLFTEAMHVVCTRSYSIK